MRTNWKFGRMMEHWRKSKLAKHECWLLCRLLTMRPEFGIVSWFDIYCCRLYPHTQSHTGNVTNSDLRSGHGNLEFCLKNSFFIGMFPLCKDKFLIMISWSTETFDILFILLDDSIKNSWLEAGWAPLSLSVSISEILNLYTHTQTHKHTLAKRSWVGGGVGGEKKKRGEEKRARSRAVQ